MSSKKPTKWPDSAGSRAPHKPSTPLKLGPLTIVIRKDGKLTCEVLNARDNQFYAPAIGAFAGHFTIREVLGCRKVKAGRIILNAKIGPVLVRQKGVKHGRPIISESFPSRLPLGFDWRGWFVAVAADAYKMPGVRIKRSTYETEMNLAVEAIFQPDTSAPIDHVELEESTASAKDFDIASLNELTSIEQTSHEVMPEDDEYDSQNWKLPDNLPVDYVAYFGAISVLRHRFHSEAAAGLQTRLNKHLQKMPQDSYDDKRSLSTWVNEQLRTLGLAIKCPKTGRPGNLVADLKGSESDISRFRLEVRNEDGKRSRTMSWRILPDLLLMEDEPRQEPLLKWSQSERNKKTHPNSGKQR